MLPIPNAGGAALVHFREKVTIRGSTTLYLHNGLQPNADDQAAGVTGQRTVPVYFHGEVVGENATIRPTQSPTGEVHFYNAVKVAHLPDSGWTSCTMYLYSPSNSWNDIEVDYGNIVFPQASGVIPSNTVLKLGSTYSSSSGRFNLGNFDATIDHIESSDAALTAYASNDAGAFTAGNLVLSNATSSVVRFVAGAAGVSPIGVTGKLAVTDGTRVEVDLSGYTGSAKKHRLFTAGSFEGDFDRVDLVVRDGNGVVRTPSCLSRADAAIDLVFVNGTIIMFR